MRKVLPNWDASHSIKQFKHSMKSLSEIFVVNSIVAVFICVVLVIVVVVFVTIVVFL